MILKKGPYLESGRTPVNELDGPLGLDACNSGLGVLGNDITTVKQCTSH
jgi:hypothetical protein